MDELLSDGTSFQSVDVLGSEVSIYDSPAYGTDGTTVIVPVSPTPSITPDIEEMEEITNNEILNAIEELKLSLDSTAVDADQVDITEEDSTEADSDEELKYNIDDVYNVISQIEQDIYINAKNVELFERLQLGFLVALFFGFVIYCFLGRIR